MNKTCRRILEEYHDGLMENIDTDYFMDKNAWKEESLQDSVSVVNSIREELGGLNPLTEKELKGRE